MAPRQGFEPRLVVLETIVLPLTLARYWYPKMDSNHRPTPYQDGATTAELLGYLEGDGRIKLPLQSP